MAELKIKTPHIQMEASGNEKFLETVLAKFHSKNDKPSPEKAGTTEVIQEMESPEPDIKHEIVVIYDNAGIPSLMRRFSVVRNSELFEGGSSKGHSSFKVGDDEVDEIYISVYPNCNINGKPYSLPGMKPWTNITNDDAARACFSKGEGWHLMTAQEWGLLANLSLKNGTLPHGNTDFGKYHANPDEKGILVEGPSGMTLTGTGPATWTHDHTVTGVHDLCGNVWEMVRGLRFKDGKVQVADNAALDVNLSESSSEWRSLIDPESDEAIRVDCKGGVRFTTSEDEDGSYNGCRWEDVKSDIGYTEEMKELALYPGEPNAYCYIDGSEGEWFAYRGGYWDYSGYAGVFRLSGSYARSNTAHDIGFRSAYFRRKTVN